MRLSPKQPATHKRKLPNHPGAGQQWPVPQQQTNEATMSNYPDNFKGIPDDVKPAASHADRYDEMRDNMAEEADRRLRAFLPHYIKMHKPGSLYLVQPAAMKQLEDEVIDLLFTRIWSFNPKINSAA
jgi:hypothetical protein